MSTSAPRSFAKSIIWSFATVSRRPRAANSATIRSSGAYIGDRFNFWAIIDVRDAAQSLEKGITADYEGAHHLYINDRVNALGGDTQTMIRLFFPDTHAFKSDLSGSTSLVSIDKARALIGYEPEHSLDSLASP